MTDKKHFGVLTELSNQVKSDITAPKTGLPNRSRGEPETTAAEFRNALEKHTAEQQGSYTEGIQKAYDELLANGTVPDNLPLGIPHLEETLKGGIPKGNLALLGPDRNKAASFDFDLPIIRHKFAPAFDAAVARRHLYKDLITRMNDEISKGPLKGCVSFTGVTKGLTSISRIQFVFSVTWTHKARNRMNAFNKYFENLKTKYLLEIAEAESKVMERE